MFLEIILIIVGFVLLGSGANLLVKAASFIAKKFGLSDMLIGLTIVAIGTSLPEIFVTIVSAIEGHSDLIIGNAIGSCICNFLLVIGVTSLVKPVKLDKRIVKRHLPIAMAMMVVLMVFGNVRSSGGVQTITRGQGFILLLFTLFYILYSIYEEKHFNKKDEIEILDEYPNEESISFFKIIIFFILGVLGLKFGADFVVDNSLLVADALSLSEKFTGMTIVAIGTALPEMITGVIAAKKGSTDLLLGNISGSNILNLCLLVGLGAVIRPLEFAIDFNASIIILFCVTVFIQMLSILTKDSKLSKGDGIILIIVYAFYIWRNL